MRNIRRLDREIMKNMKIIGVSRYAKRLREKEMKIML